MESNTIETYECTNIKRCCGKNGCGKWKPTSEFNKKQSKCKDCQKKYDQQYHKEHLLERKQYDLNNKDKKQKHDKKYREKHKETINLYQKQYYSKNKEKLKLYSKERRKNKIISIEQKQHNRRKERNKYIINIYFRLAKTLRHRLRMSIKNNSKSGSAVKDLGCTIKELKQYLEKQFYNNPVTNEQMTWSNWTINGWHIDHIRPLCSFDLTDKQQLIEACHYTNLRPLWSEENLKKISEDRKKSINNKSCNSGE